MPNVPNAPGVPPLSSYGASNVALLIADVIASIGGQAGTQWGIFLNGAPIIDGDSVVSFDFKQDFPVSDYPVEKGGFQSYDKVQLPADIRVRYSAGGSIANRQVFLDSIEAVMNTVDLYDIVTPEITYLGYNFTHRDFRRTAANGVGLIVVDLWLTEIRVTSTATFINTQQPGEAGQQNGGNVQGQETGSIIQNDFSELNSSGWGGH